MVNVDKAKTFIGFAIRSNKYKIGTNAVQTLKRANLLLVCNTASPNTKKEAEKISRKLGCKIIVTKGYTLAEATYRDNAMIMAITDENLAKAIEDNSVISGEDGQENI